MPLYDEPLLEGSVRLLRLLRRSDEHSRIECQLITCSLLDSRSTHPFEALSYRWGPENDQKPIYIDGCELSVRANLHAALSHLQDRYIERIMWIDAICINQGDNVEKGSQVQSMAKIYAKASRVIVWLGQAADHSDQALEVIRKAAEEHDHTESAVDESSQKDILTLLKREWFQRVWVLQEVAAARHVRIKCGPTEIDGYAFCSGLSALNLSYETSQDLKDTILSIAYLIRGAIFRPQYERCETSRPDRFSLNIRPLSELVDMYHTRKAVDRRDKVYALLGMSSDDPSTAGLSADYDTPWKDVFQKLVKFSLSDQMSVSTWDSTEVAVVEGKGSILGEVSSVGKDTTRNGRQHVDIAWNGTSYFETKGKQSSPSTFQVSAKPIQVGDVVCLLQGASNPTIIRPCNGFSTIIMIAVPLTGSLRKCSAPTTTFLNDLLLVWDWARRKTQDEEDYGDLVTSRGVPKCLKTECQCLDYLDKATRLWNFGLLLNRMERYEEAGKYLRRAVGAYRDGTELRSVGQTYPDHGPWREADKEALGTMDGLTIDSKVALIEEKYREYGQTPLLWAAEEGYKAVVRLLLEKGAAIEVKDNNGWTPLMWATDKGHEAIVRLLLEKGAAIGAKDKVGRTPLAWAAEKGQDAIVRLLIEKGAFIEVKDDDGWTPLWRAAMYRHKAVLRLLLEKGAVIEARDNTGWTPLARAAERGYETVVLLLLENGAVMEVKDKDGWTSLARAAEKGHETVVSLLLEKGAAIEANDKDGGTPLVRAAERGHEATVHLLLEKGAAIEAKDNNGWTPLAWAADNGHEAVVRLLLEKGAAFEAKDKAGRTPLAWAAQKGQEAIVRLLLEKGAAIEAKDNNGWTPLIWAAEKGYEAVVLLLLEKGAAIEAKDNNSWTPLAWAADKGHEAIVLLLLEKGAVIEAKDNNGWTPLAWAAEKGHEAIVLLLLEKGAVIEAKDNYGQTPLWWAAIHGHEAVVRLLLEKGASIEAKDNDGWTPLAWAAEKGHEAIVRLLLEKGAPIEVEDNTGWTPLARAAEKGHDAVVLLLLEKGAAVEANDKYGWTPLERAAVKGHSAIVRLLQSDAFERS